MVRDKIHEPYVVTRFVVSRDGDLIDMTLSLPPPLSPTCLFFVIVLSIYSIRPTVIHYLRHPLSCLMSHPS